jgi:DNA adenine methylase
LWPTPRQEAAVVKKNARPPKVDPPLKYPGGKGHMTDLILAGLPPREKYHTFVDACAGSGRVVLAHDPTGKAEVLNDLDRGVHNFWAVLRDPDLFAQFQRRCQASPFSQDVFRDACDTDTRFVLATRAGGAELPPDQRVAWAHAVFVRTRQSHMGCGRSPAALTKNRTRRGMQEQVSAWLTCVDGLAAVHARLARVCVTREPVAALVRRFDATGCLQFVDPPYFPDTRQPDLYRTEMGVAGHEELVDRLLAVDRAFVMLCGYDCSLYRRLDAAGWTRRELTLASSMTRGAAKPSRTEVLWTNYDSGGTLVSRAGGPPALDI